MTIPKEIRREAIDYVKSGKTLEQAAQLCNISTYSVGAFAKAAGVSARIRVVKIPSTEAVTAFIECIKDGRGIETCILKANITTREGYAILKENNLRSGEECQGLGQNAYRVIALLQNTQLNKSEISRELGITRERVRQIHEAAKFNEIKFKNRK